MGCARRGISWIRLIVRFVGMRGIFKEAMKLLLLVFTAGSLLADGPGRLESKYVGKDWR